MKLNTTTRTSMALACTLAAGAADKATTTAKPRASQAARAEQGGVDASVQRAPGTGVALEQEALELALVQEALELVLVRVV